MPAADEEALEWVLRWFKARGAVEARLRTDYFEAGLIDSLAVVTLVTDIESAFSVRFEDRHYQDPRFSTIGGLAEIIAELAAAKRV